MFKVDVSGIIGLSEAFADAGGIKLDVGIKQGLHIAGAEIQAQAREWVPVDTTALKVSIANDVGVSSSAISQEIGPTQPYGADIEKGRPVGTKVSPQALAGWARRKGLNPYTVARKIEKYGSPAQPYLFPAMEQKKDSVYLILGQAVINTFDEAFSKI